MIYSQTKQNTSNVTQKTEFSSTNTRTNFFFFLLKPHSFSLQRYIAHQCFFHTLDLILLLLFQQCYFNLGKSTIKNGGKTRTKKQKLKMFTKFNNIKLLRSTTTLLYVTLFVFMYYTESTRTHQLLLYIHSRKYQVLFVKNMITMFER